MGTFRKKVRCAFERATTGAVRYSELGYYPDPNTPEWLPTPQGRQPIVGTIYIRKAAISPRRWPEAIDLTIESVDLSELEPRE